MIGCGCQGWIKVLLVCSGQIGQIMLFTKIYSKFIRLYFSTMWCLNGLFSGDIYPDLQLLFIYSVLYSTNKCSANWKGKLNILSLSFILKACHWLRPSFSLHFLYSLLLFTSVCFSVLIFSLVFLFYLSIFF